MAGNRPIEDRERSFYDAQLLSTPVVLAVGTESNCTSSALSVGGYTVSSNANCYCVQCGSSSTEAAASNAHPLWKNTYRDFSVSGSGDDYLAVIAESAGTVWISKK